MKFFSFSFLFFLNFWMLTFGFGQQSALLKTISPAKPKSMRLEILTGELKAVEEKLPSIRKLYSEGVISRKEKESFEQKHGDLLRERQSIKAEIARAEAAKVQSLKHSGSTTPKVRFGNTKNRTAVSANRSKQSAYRPKSVVLKSSGSMIQDTVLQDLKRYYSDTFRESLPISAVGQSATHDRLGWDHSGRIDLAIHPDSSEGQAVMEFLREHKVAFLGFRANVPGCSTGAHIHIGLPSSKIQ
jgi:hypothetical protein